MSERRRARLNPVDPGSQPGSKNTSLLAAVTWSLTILYLMVLVLRWTHALVTPGPIVEDQVLSAVAGKLTRVGLYGGRPALLGVARWALDEDDPGSLACLAMVEQGAGQSQRADGLWRRVTGEGWGRSAALYYLHGLEPTMLPPPGFYRDQLELDRKRLTREQMQARAGPESLELGLGAAILGLNLLASGLLLLTWPWVRRWLPASAQVGPAPRLGVAWLIFLGVHLTGPLAGILFIGLPAEVGVLVLQAFTYVLWFSILWPVLGLRLRRPSRSLLGMGLLGYWLCLPAAWVATALTSLLFGSNHSVNPVLLLLSQAQGALWWALVLMAGLAAPAFEEILYRGCLYRSMRARWGPRPAMLASAMVFATVHADPWEVLPLTALGLVFAWLVERTGSLISSTVAHACWNGATLLMLALGRG